MQQTSQCHWQMYRSDVLTLGSMKYGSVLLQIFAHLLVVMLHSLATTGRTQLTNAT